MKLLFSNLLNIFHTGGVTEGLGVVALFIAVFIWWKVPKQLKQPYGYNDSASGAFIQTAPKTKLHQLPRFWLGLAVIVAYILVIAFIVAPDYKGV